MKITPEVFEIVRSTVFLRPRFSNIQLEYVHTKLVNKIKRRGNYRFQVLLPYRSEDQIKKINTHFVLQPQRSPFFITHTLLHGKTPLDEFLENIETNGLGKLNGNAVLVQSEERIDKEKLESMKNGLITALTDTDPQKWKLKSGRIWITINDIGIYKFKPLIAF